MKINLSASLQVLGLFILVNPSKSSQCNLTDPSQTHVCLHVFLERDFPLIDRMMNNPNFIREGGELEEMCR